MADPYLTVAQLREVPDLSQVSKVSNAALEEFMASFEEVAERYLGVAYRARTATVTRPYSRGCTLFLPHVEVSAVTAVVIDGTTLTSDQRGELVILGDIGAVERSAGWGRLNDLTYVHGYADPPPTLLRAARRWVRHEVMLDRTPRSDNTLVTLAEDAAGGRFVAREATPDWDAGRPTGWLDVDPLLNQLPNRRVPGIA